MSQSTSPLRSPTLLPLPSLLHSSPRPSAGTVCVLPLCTCQVSLLSVAIDALIVAIETQDQFLGSKKTWTRKIVLLTDGESPIEVEDWEATVKKMNALDISLTVV